jgi:predicted lipoprotein with Yx(FWY)xxD motif
MMTQQSSHGAIPRRSRWRVTLALAAAALAGSSLAAATSASASPRDDDGFLRPGNLLVTTGVWTTNADITAGTTQLPPNCATANPAFVTCGTAVAPGTYPIVFNNDASDGSFGVTEPIVLDELNPHNGRLVTAVTVPDNPARGDYLTTSFSSKSELAVAQSTDGRYDTFIGYVAAPGTIDASNSNTPGEIDPTIADSATPVYRAVAQVNEDGRFGFTETNAFSGDNGRAAILDPQDGRDGTIFAVGNAGNGANPEPAAVIDGAGSQILTPAHQPEAAQNPGTPIPFGNFNIAELGHAADKSGKDNNYRGVTLYDGVVYFTKGSGGNGVDTVYFADPNGSATAANGVGLPSTSETLPSVSNWIAPTYSTNTPALGLTTKNPGLTPTNADILKGFPTALAKNATDASDYPFGLWFANPTTLYVADEGAGDNTYDATTNTFTAAAASTTAGLQKWSFNSSTGEWQLDYVLQSGLHLGTPYQVAPDRKGDQYPTGLNNTDGGTGLPWSPATDGLRGLTGRVNRNGTVSLWASTSTVSGSGDQGADPNKLVEITDNLDATTASQVTYERFHTVMRATYGQVVRGVSFTPGTPLTNGNDTSPSPRPSLPRVASGRLASRERG